jgi:uncharacterized protein DUF6880/SWIM zinc finger
MKPVKKKAKAGGEAVVPRFDVGALKAMAGDKAFARGEAYFADGRVEILEAEHGLVRARVAGTEIYRAELQSVGKRLSGECSCPAFSDRSDFCKHLVAVALTVNGLKPGVPVPNRFARIREHLKAQDRAALVELILSLAERDTALLDDLELAASMNGDGDDEALFSRFKQAITAATRISDYVEYSEARAWASNIETVLKRVGDLIGRGKAPPVLKLLDHFFARMEAALPSIDDSNGHGGALLAQASELHFKACRAAKPEPIALARELFQRETEWQWDYFHGASETYAKVLGERGLAEYRRLAEAAWAEIKPLLGGARRVHDDQSMLRYSLQSILESFAEREGDIDAMIAIRARDLSSAYRYLQVAKLCADHGRTTEALKWAEEGLWHFEDDPDRRLVAFASNLRRRLQIVSSLEARKRPGSDTKTAASPTGSAVQSKGRR